MKYAMLLTDTTNAKADSNTTQFLGNIVKGIIEGETRVLVSSMTMEEIFTEREEFSKSPPAVHIHSHMEKTEWRLANGLPNY